MEEVIIILKETSSLPNKRIIKFFRDNIVTINECKFNINIVTINRVQIHQETSFLVKRGIDKFPVMILCTNLYFGVSAIQETLKQAYDAKYFLNNKKKINISSILVAIIFLNYILENELVYNIDTLRYGIGYNIFEKKSHAG